MGSQDGVVGSCDLVGTSEVIAALRKEIGRIAPTPANVVVAGESGAGKRHVARLLHQQSLRAEAPFVTCTCSGVPDALLESELFGHLQGSFAGAYRDKPGVLTLLDGGTLCLDEPAAMSAAMQGKLLQFMTTGQVQPVGGAAIRTSDVRFVTTTTHDLAAEVSRGAFRADLLHRLRVVHLHVPPLRERPEDVAALVTYWLTADPDFPWRGAEMSPAAMEMVHEYSWPGNVRELRNAVEWAAMHTSSSVIEVTDFPAEIRTAAGT